MLGNNLVLLDASLIASIVGMPGKLYQFESWYDAMLLPDVLVSNRDRDKSHICEIGYMDTKLLMMTYERCFCDRHRTSYYGIMALVSELVE